MDTLDSRKGESATPAANSSSLKETGGADPKFTVPGRACGDYPSSKTYYDPGDSDLKLAGYLGLKDIADLRKILLSRPMLLQTTAIINGGLHKRVNWNDAFEEIADTVSRAERSPLAEWGQKELRKKFGDDVDLEEKFPDLGTSSERKENRGMALQHRLHRAFRFAGHIYRLKQRLEEYRGQDTEARSLGVKEAREAFKSAAAITRFNFPKVDVTDYLLPNLGPWKEFGEDFMEPYNRAYMLYRYLYHESTKSGRQSFLNSKNPFMSKKVGDEYIPLFMRKMVADPKTQNRLLAPEQQKVVVVVPQKQNVAHPGTQQTIAAQKQQKMASLNTQHRVDPQEKQRVMSPKIQQKSNELEQAAVNQKTRESSDTPEQQTLVNPKTHHSVGMPKHQSFAPKKFTYKWKLTMDDLEAREHLAKYGEEIPRSGSLKFDPRLLNLSGFRDAIRIQFEFQRFGVQISRLKIGYLDIEGVQTNVDTAIHCWKDEILPVLIEKPEKEICVIFGVRLLDEGEALRECEDLPSEPSLVKLVRTREDSSNTKRKRPSDREVEQRHGESSTNTNPAKRLAHDCGAATGR